MTNEERDKAQDDFQNGNPQTLSGTDYLEFCGRHQSEHTAAQKDIQDRKQ